MRESVFVVLAISPPYSFLSWMSPNRNCFVLSEKNNRLLQLMTKIVVVHNLSVPLVVNGKGANQEHVPAPLHSTETTEPIVIPEPARRLEKANDWVVPHPTWAVEDGCQHLVVVTNNIATVICLPRFTYMLVHDGLKKHVLEDVL